MSEVPLYTSAVSRVRTARAGRLSGISRSKATVVDKLATRSLQQADPCGVCPGLQGLLEIKDTRRP